MVASKLYKYLDANGGLLMLQNSNLQFTNATKFNDPFDCHPALFDYSNVPATKNNWPPADFMKLKGETDMENLRNSIWICCLSKVYDSLLMWSYYNSHKGICIGLNINKVLKIFLGVNIFPQNKDEIIKAAKRLNPEIKIYQMTTDSEVFRLKEQLIE